MTLTILLTLATMQEITCMTDGPYRHSEEKRKEISNKMRAIHATKKVLTQLQTTL